MSRDWQSLLDDILESARRVRDYTAGHAYFTVNADIVWDVVANKLPELARTVQDFKDAGQE